MIRTSSWMLYCTFWVSAMSVSAQFTPGRLAVLEWTSGTSSGGAYTIREFQTDGTPGLVLNVPTTGPNAVVGLSSSTIASQLIRTPSGDALLFTGFASMAASGTSLLSTSAADIPRVVGRVDASGNFSHAISTSTYFSGSTMVGLAFDGLNYWGSSGQSGVVYLGPGPQVVVNNESPTITSLGNRSGQLHAVGNPGTVHFAAAAPTAPSARVAAFTHVGTLSPTDVQFSPDGTIAYTSHFNQVEKWQWTGSAWTYLYTLNCTTAGGAWLVRIVVDHSGPVPVIYGVHNSPTKLVKWVDNGAGSPEQLLYAPSGFPRWYGIAFTPNCIPGASCDDGNSSTGNDVYNASCICSGQPNDCQGVPGGTALPGSACDDGNMETGGDTWQTNCTCTGYSVLLAAKAFLAGALPGGINLMNDNLRTLPTFPLNEPYTALGMAPTGGAGSIQPLVLSNTGTNAIVDWVLVELRSATNPQTLVARRAALVQRDGDIVDVDGISTLSLPASAGNYHVAVRHRNHLGVMSASAIVLNSTTAASLDLRLSTTGTWGTNARATVGTAMASWSGNVTNNGQLAYIGSGNDRDLILVRVGGTTPNNVVAGYHQEDVNLNGSVSYTGTGNDRDPILVNIGSTTPNNQRFEQLP